MRTYLKRCRHGEFLLIHGDMISEYINLYGEWCEGEVELFNKIIPRDGVVVEVGANIGAHTVPIAKACPDGKVICFEPQRIIFSVLCGNLALNNIINTFPVHGGVGEHDDVTSIPQGDYSNAWNYGSFSIDKGYSTEGAYSGNVVLEKVNLYSLDQYSLKHSLNRVDLLKIDAEGYEIKVLNGAKRVIEQFRPVIFLENNREAESASLLSEVRRMGYTPYWFCSTRHRQNNFNNAFWHVDGVDINIICYPSESACPFSLKEAIEFTADIRGGKLEYY